MRSADTLCCAVLGCVLAGCAAPELERVERARAAMGTEFRVIAYAHEPERAEAAIEEALARIQALDRALTDYDPESELSRLGARTDQAAPTDWIPVSDELFTVLAAADELAHASGGAFDVTVGPYSRLWRRARRQGELPEPGRLAEAAKAVGFEKLRLDREHQRVRLEARAMRLDLGGIAKGYALDEAFEILVRHGCPRALVVGGGELRAGAAPPGQSGWRVELVGLDGPSTALELVHAALATSGDLEQVLVLDGTHHSHILDPRTGLALTERRLVSVLGPRALSTDALATAVSVLGPEAGLALIARSPGYEARVTVLRDQQREVRCSAGFPAGLSSRAAPPP